MKKALFFPSLLMCLAILQSCEKEEKVDKSHPIIGHWIGTYNILEAAESGSNFYYSFFIRTDDSLQVQSVGADGFTYYGIGTWKLQDSVFTATITTTNASQTGVAQSATAIFDKKKGLLRDGIVETPGLFKASFKLERVN